MIDDGASRLLHWSSRAEEKRGLLWNLVEAVLYRYHRILQLSLIQLCVTTPRAPHTSSPTSDTGIPCYHAALVALGLTLL